MSFRLVPKSVTLNDLKRRNSSNGCVIAPNLVAFWVDYVNVVKDTLILSAEEMWAKIYILAIYHLGDISRGSPLIRVLN